MKRCFLLGRIGIGAAVLLMSTGANASLSVCDDAVVSWVWSNGALTFKVPTDGGSKKSDFKLHVINSETDSNPAVVFLDRARGDVGQMVRSTVDIKFSKIEMTKLAITNKPNVANSVVANIKNMPKTRVTISYPKSVSDEKDGRLTEHTWCVASGQELQKCANEIGLGKKELVEIHNWTGVRSVSRLPSGVTQAAFEELCEYAPHESRHIEVNQRINYDATHSCKCP